MIPPTMQLAGYALAAGLAIGAGAGWKVHAWKEDADKLEAERAAREQLEKEQQRGNEIAAGWAAAAEVLRKQQHEITRTVTVEVEKPVYRDCAMPDTGRLLLEQAIDKANAARQSSAALPGTAATGGK